MEVFFIKTGPAGERARRCADAKPANFLIVGGKRSGERRRRPPMGCGDGSILKK